MNRGNTIIINGIRNGNDKIIKEFYKKHLPQITSFILKNSGNPDDAKDVFQDAMIIVYEKISANTLNIDCALGTYVYGISKYLWLNKLRKSDKIENNEIIIDRVDTNFDDPLDVVQKTETKFLIQKKLLELGSGCKEILLMFHAGYSIREIAEQRSTTEGYMRKRKFICQKQLMELVEKDSIFEELYKLSKN